MELKEAQSFWKTYRTFPAYQHLGLLLDIPKEYIDKMFYWDCLLDEIALHVKKEYQENKSDNRKGIDSEWRSEFPEFSSESRVRYLQVVIDFLEKRIIDYEDSLERNRKRGLSFPIRSALASIWDIEKTRLRLKKYQIELYREKYKNEIKEGQITDEMIQIARDYPMENLIEVNSRKFARCPFHNEKTGSFYVKNNFGYCFGCAKHCDSIALYQHIYSVPFVEAVKSLSK